MLHLFIADIAKYVLKDCFFGLVVIQPKLSKVIIVEIHEGKIEGKSIYIYIYRLS